MRILFTAARFPLPLDTGAKIRTFHLLSAVARKHEVTFLCPVSTESERELVSQLVGRLPDVTVDVVDVPEAKQSLARLAIATGRNIVEPMPLTWMRYQWSTLRRRISAHASVGAFDLVHCDHVQIAPLVLDSAIRPRVIDAHNIESSLMRSIARTVRKPWLRLALQWQGRKALRAERRVYRGFHHAITCSTVDRDRLRALAPKTPITIVANGVDTDHFSPVEGAEQPATLAYTGSMDWAPNVDAVRYFVGEILPRLRSHSPASRLLVIGRNAPTDLLQTETPGVDVTGTVPDVRPLLASATAVIVPLRSGGGTRLKILEAWAMRKAVVSTSIGAEGLRAEDNENILLADSPEQFAVQCHQLLTDVGLRNRIAEGGYRTAMALYDWSRVGEQLLAAYDEAIVRAIAFHAEGPR